MKITVFNGSPWGQLGHTYLMTEAFLSGASQAGAKTQQIQLVEKDINACIGCGVCFYKTPGKCIFKDDMQGLIHKFLTSDVVIFATPLYMDNVTTRMKTFMDRLMPILEPHYEKTQDGLYRRGIRFDKHPKFVVISASALPEQNQFDVLRLFFKKFAMTMHTEIAGEIYCPNAGLLLLSKTDMRFAAVVHEYTQLLRQAGKEFTASGRISEDIEDRLQVPLIDPDEYVKYANELWNMILPKRTFLGIPVSALDKTQSRKVKI